MLREHATLAAIAAGLGFYCLWAAFKHSPYYPLNRRKTPDAFEDYLRGITPTEERRRNPAVETPFSRTLKDNNNG